MFEFTEVNLNPQATEIQARCLVRPELPCFNGHFSGHPIMPAVAILEMLDHLIDTQTDWQSSIEGGKALKFLEPIAPGDEVHIRFTLQDKPGRARFEITRQGTLAAKGDCLFRSDAVA